MTISTPIATEAIETDTPVAKAKVKRPKVLVWTIAFVVVIFASTMLMPYIHSAQNIYASMFLTQILNLVALTLFAITIVQFYRWVLSFVDFKGMFKTIMKAYAKK